MAANKNKPRGVKTHWSYWVFVLGFLALALGCFNRGLRDGGQDRIWELGGGIVFFTLGFGGITWPILQRLETKGTQAGTIHLFGLHCEALIIPASRVRQFLILAGSALLAIGVLVLLLSGEMGVDLIKGLLALAIYTGAFVWGLRSVLNEPKGIYLVPKGIVWCEMFRAPCFIPWDIISATAACSKQEKYVPRATQAFGLDVSDLEAVQTTKSTRQFCQQSKAREGWHFVFLEESLVVQVKVVESIIRYYRAHPEARGEIGTVNSRLRMQEFELAAVGYTV